MLDLKDMTEGAGTELAELKAYAALFHAAGAGTDLADFPELSKGDMANIGWALIHLAKRLEARLDEIEKREACKAEAREDKEKEGDG